MIGRTLLHYRIIERLGAGGMGEVYLAEDAKLNRRVALKVLPGDMAAQPERLARFQREAESVAALSHPNIVTLFSVEEAEGVHFLTMELVEGDDLKDLIPSGGMPLAQILDLAIPIADALSAAHEAGVVHRDLKPSNLMVDQRSHVRIMDFGLAKLQATDDVESSDLATEALTQEGTQLGTVPYMAPEQVQGKPADQRTDLFALGIVLHEMATGVRPFIGESGADIMSAILRDDPPPLSATRSDLPRQLERIVAHCLQKAPERRFQTALDLRNELQSLRDETTVAIQRGEPPAASARGGLPPWVIAAGAVLVLAILVWRFADRPQNETLQQAPVVSAERRVAQLTFGGELEEWPAYSPDGTKLAYSAERGGFRKLHLRDLETGEVEQVTDGFGDDVKPEWAPDGSRLVFVRASAENGKLEPDDLFGNFFEGGDIWSLDLENGEASRLIEDAYSPKWSADGLRLALDAEWAGAARIWSTDARGRNPRQITSDSSEAVAHVEPAWSPDGTKIVFRRREKSKSDVHVVDVASGVTFALTDDNYRDLQPQWSPDGTAIIFSSYRGGGQNLWKQPVDASGRPSGAAEQLTTGAGNDVQPSISPDGKNVAFAVLGINSDLWRLPVDPLTGEALGRPQELVSTTREDSRGAWSPDGATLAFNSDRLGEMNIWLKSLDDGAETQLTSGPGGDFQPVWSPDGTRIVFFSSRAGNVDIWEVDIATGELVQLTDDPSVDEDPFYSPDGRRIAFQSDRDGRLEVWLMNADGSDQRALSSIGTSGHFMRWLDDGTAVLHRTSSAQATNMFLQPIDGSEAEPMPPIEGGGWHISFSPDRRSILDVTGHHTLWIYPASGEERRKVFEFEDPDIRIDYPVWSPEGRWAVFDRAVYSGADIWVLQGL